MTSGIQQKGRNATCEARSQKHGFGLCLPLFDHLLWGSPATTSWAAYGKVHMYLTKTSSQMLCEWATLEISFCLSQVVRWQQPWPAYWVHPHERPWARTTQLSCSALLTLKPCKINICCFKLLKSGIITYPAMDNYNVRRKINCQLYKMKNYTSQNLDLKFIL